MKTILCFGDSNTYGLIPGYKGRYNFSTRWTGILSDMLEEYNFRIVEEGLCGRTTVFDDEKRDFRNGSETLSLILETHSPIDYVILMLGTNDCKKCYSPTDEKIGDGVLELISIIKSFDRNIKIILISPVALRKEIFKISGFDEYDENSVIVSQLLKERYKSIAEKESCLFLSASDFAKTSLVDCEHLDENGHRILACEIKKLIFSDIEKHRL